jgi:lipopolysaccharide biosynthesis glycosyltransferase
MKQIDDFCAITEANNRSFANSRLAIFTFIKCNPWFEGTVIILTLKSNPLTSENIKNINLLYDKIEILEVPDDDLISIKNRISKKGWDPNSLLEHLYLKAFDIKSRGSIYFSRNTLFQKDISSFLNDNKLSVTISSQKFPSLDTESIELIDHSLMYIPSNIINMKIRSILEENLLGDNIFKSDAVSNSLIKVITLDRIKRFSNQYLISSSNFPNHRYTEFIRYQKGIYAIKMNTGELGGQNYSRINTYWNHLNKSIIDDLRKPREYKGSLPSIPNKIIEPKRHLNIGNLNPKSEVKINDLNIALCTICNNEFIDGLMVMLSSFLRNNIWFKGKIIVYYHNEYSPISISNMNRARSIYGDIDFKPVNVSQYQKLINKFLKMKRAQRRLIPSLFTFEVFEDIKYFDKILYLDSDMLVLNDISEIFKLNHDIVVTPDAGEYIKRDYSTFNGGFLLLSHSISNKEYKKKLIDHAETMKDMVLADQTIMNSFFPGGIPMLEIDYNCLKRCFPDNKFSQFNSNVKIVHYVGSKPWDPIKSDFESKYKKIEDLWKKEFMNLKLGSELNIVTSAASIDSNKKINGRIMTTNWGIEIDFPKIDYYICSVNEPELIKTINRNHKKIDKFLITNNLVKNLNFDNFNHIELFEYIRNIGKLGNVHMHSKKERGKLNLPTSGIQMIYIASFMKLTKLNILGINLYTIKDENGDYKSLCPTSKENPYTLKEKPHDIETDLIFIIDSFKRLISSKVEINVDSNILELILDMCKQKNDNNIIIKKVKEKYDF